MLRETSTLSSLAAYSATSRPGSPPNSSQPPCSPAPSFSTSVPSPPEPPGCCRFTSGACFVPSVRCCSTWDCSASSALSAKGDGEEEGEVPPRRRRSPRRLVATAPPRPPAARKHSNNTRKSKKKTPMYVERPTSRAGHVDADGAKQTLGWRRRMEVLVDNTIYAASLRVLRRQNSPPPPPSPSMVPGKHTCRPLLWRRAQIEDVVPDEVVQHPAPRFSRRRASEPPPNGLPFISEGPGEKREDGGGKEGPARVAHKTCVTGGAGIVRASLRGSQFTEKNSNGESHLHGSVVFSGG